MRSQETTLLGDASALHWTVSRVQAPVKMWNHEGWFSFATKRSWIGEYIQWNQWIIFLKPSETQLVQQHCSNCCSILWFCLWNRSSVRFSASDTSWAPGRYWCARSSEPWLQPIVCKLYNETPDTPNIKSPKAQLVMWKSRPRMKSLAAASSWQLGAPISQRLKPMGSGQPGRSRRIGPTGSCWTQVSPLALAPSNQFLDW